MKPGIIIEINEHWLKVAGMKPFPTGGRRLAVAARQLPAGSDAAAVSETLVRLLKEEKMKASSCILCVSRSQGMFWNLTLPSDDPKEIGQMVELNVARIVPDKREQVIYNHAVAGKNEQGFSRVTLAIMQRDLITRQIVVAEGAGLQVEQIVLSSFGVFSMVGARFRSVMAPADVNLVLDIDANFVDLLIFSGDNLLSSRSINIGSEQLGDEGNVKKLIGEIRQALAVFHSQEGGQNPSRMFVSGAQGNSEGIIAAAKQELGIEVTAAFAPAENRLPWNLSFTACAQLAVTGGAVPGIDFVVPEIEVRKSLRQKTREIMAAGMMVFYLCVAVAAVGWGRQYLYQGYEAFLSKRINEVSGSLGDTVGRYEQQRFVAEQLAARKLPMAFLGYLIKTIPSEIAVKYVALDKDRKVVLKGEAQELSDIFRFVSTLEKSEFCKDVKTRSTRKRKIREKEMTDFELNFLLGI